MRCAWPITEMASKSDLARLAVPQLREIARRHGFVIDGLPYDWQIVRGSTWPDFAAYTHILTCLVPVAEQKQEAAA